MTRTRFMYAGQAVQGFRKHLHKDISVDLTPGYLNSDRMFALILKILIIFFSCSISA